MQFTLAGEFRDGSKEAAYCATRLPENRRALRLAMLWAFGLNFVFVASDLRFMGHPHLAAALASRGTILAASLACAALCRGVDSHARLQALVAAWAVPVIAACAVLVSSASTVALLILFILPVIFHLVVPVSFALRTGAALACTSATLASYLAAVPSQTTATGLVCGLLTLNAVLVLATARTGRLSRQAWSALGDAKAANAELASHRRTLQTVLQAVPVPLLIFDPASGRLLEANGAARDFFGQARLTGTADARELFEPAVRARLTPSRPAGAAADRFEARLPWPDGSGHEGLVAVARVEVEDSQACLAAVVDITGRKELEAYLRQQARTDRLTGLADASRFTAEAASLLRRADATPVAVILVSPDGFAGLARELGPQAGNTVLRAVAGLIRSHVTPPCLAARLGGATFALLVPGCDAAAAGQSAEHLVRTAQALYPDGLPQGRSLDLIQAVGVVRPGEKRIAPALARAGRALVATRRSWTPAKAGSADTPSSAQ
jgi:diguanylate cyclase (GGDEF)-like protein